MVWDAMLQRTYEAGGLRLGLPVRRQGGLRVLAAFLIGFAGLFLWQPVASLVRMALGAQGLEGIGSLVFLLPFLLGGAVPLAMGLALLFGTTEVSLREGRLEVAERLGPLAWRRRLPVESPIRQEVLGSVKGGTQAPGGFGVLVAHYGSGARRVVALGYPEELLRQLGDEVRSWLGGGLPPVAVVTALEVEPAPADVIEQPSGSDIRVVWEGTTLRLEVPSPGLRKSGALGLLVFAGLWCGFMAVFSVGALAQPGTFLALAPLLLMAAFWAVGLGLALLAVHLARRWATLEVTPGELRITTGGAFGSRVRTWRRGDLASIGEGPSNVAVNDRPLHELQLHPASGKKVGLLRGRDPEELRWVARMLGDRLGLRSR